MMFYTQKVSDDLLELKISMACMLHEINLLYKDNVTKEEVIEAAERTFIRVIEDQIYQTIIDKRKSR